MSVLLFYILKGDFKNQISYVNFNSVIPVGVTSSLLNPLLKKKKARKEAVGNETLSFLLIKLALEEVESDLWAAGLPDS